jgi:hypothetical protein
MSIRTKHSGCSSSACNTELLQEPLSYAPMAMPARISNSLHPPSKWHSCSLSTAHPATLRSAPSMSQCSFVPRISYAQLKLKHSLPTYHSWTPSATSWWGCWCPSTVPFYADRKTATSSHKNSGTSSLCTNPKMKALSSCSLFKLFIYIWMHTEINTLTSTMSASFSPGRSGYSSSEASLTICCSLQLGSPSIYLQHPSTQSASPTPSLNYSFPAFLLMAPSLSSQAIYKSKMPRLVYNAQIICKSKSMALLPILPPENEPSSSTQASTPIALSSGSLKDCLHN